MSPRNDEDRLRDMLDAARKAVAAIQGLAGCASTRHGLWFGKPHYTLFRL